MNMPLVLLNRRRRGFTAFSPSTLFALAEPGVWFDPSDLTTLFTDPAGTTPVTAPGNTVGLMLDKSRGLALGAELVANGFTLFAGTGAPVGVSTGTMTYTGGVLTINRLTADAAAAWLNASLPASTTAVVSFRVVSGDGIFATTANNIVVAGSYSYRIATGAGVRFWPQNTNSTLVIDNISVRELAGNHATQATIAARPTYSVEPVGGRRNLLTWSEDLSNAIWVKTNATIAVDVAVAPDGATTADRIIPSASAAFHFAQASATLTVGVTYTASVYVKPEAGGARYAYIWVGGGNVYAVYDTQTGLVTFTSSGVTASMTAETNGYYRCTLTRTAVSGDANVLVGPTTLSNSGTSTTAATDTLLLWGAQLELGSTVTPYQRVTTQHDVTEAGVASVGYLYFDGASDAMATSTITPGTDKVQVFAGVRKLSTSANVVAETSANSDVNNGAFALGTNSSGGSNYLVQARGTNLAFYIPAGYSTPSTDVISGLLDIAGATLAAEIVPRINGVVNQTGGGGGNVGTGNFLAYPLYLGGRAGTSFLFSGHLYSLITRFGPTLDAPTITSTEIWVGDKTGIDVAKNISTTIYTRSGDTILDRANSTIERRAV